METSQKGFMGRKVRIRTIVIFGVLLLVIGVFAFMWMRATPLYTVQAAHQEPECITEAPNSDVLIGLSVSGGGSRAEQDLATATANIGVAQASRFPQLSLTGALGFANPQLGSFAPGVAFTQFASASIAGPLLNATSLGFQVNVAEARTRQAAFQYEKAIVTAFKEVEDALIATQKSREQRTAQESQVAALRSALNLADLRYKGGRLLS